MYTKSSLILQINEKKNQIAKLSKNKYVKKSLTIIASQISDELKIL